MAVELRWRKALAVSFVLHCTVLAGLGWMAVHAFVTTEVQEKFIELDLVGEAGGEMAGGAPAAGKPEEVVREPEPTVAAVVPEVPMLSEKELPSSMTVVDNKQPILTAVTGGLQGTSGVGGTGSVSGPGGSEAGGGVIPPGILARVEPSYPEHARQAGIQGITVLKIQILENGRPGEVLVHASSGYELLDEAAVSAVRRWRFVPAKERNSGQAIACYTTMPVIFKLRS